MTQGRGDWRRIWIRGGKIDETAWVGKDVLAWCSGMQIVFFHTTQKYKNLQWRWKSEDSDGVCCLSGHPVMQILAFSEKSLRDPRIIVLSYPSKTKISECLGGSENGYLATAFTPADYLITLGSYPNFSLTIWAWRTGERLSSIDTSISDVDCQIIRVSDSKPTLIAQLGRSSGKLHIWETSSAGKTIILTNHEVVLPKEATAHHMDWSSESGEPLLAVVDRLGIAYISNQDGSNVYRIILAQRCGVCLEYEAPLICWFRDGILLKMTFCQIRFFKKDKTNFWRREWYVKSELKPCVLSVHSSKTDRLFYHTQEGFLMELNMTEGQKTPVVEKRLYYGAIYYFLESIRPWGHHVLAIDDPMEVTILDCYDGQKKARLDLEMEGEITQLSSHPDYPLAAVTSKSGELALLSLRAPESPFVIARFHLQSERLDLIKFSHSGKYLVVGQRTTGICYCVSLIRHKPFVVTARIDTKCRMADVLLFDTRGRLKLLVLVVSSKRATVGQHLILYDLQSGKNSSNEPTSYLELPYAYQYLNYAPEGMHFLIGTPYLSRQIHLLEISDWKQVNLVDAMPSGHQVRRGKVSTDRFWITSVAIDGIVTLRNGTTREVAAILNPHHRRDLGVTKVVVKPSGELIVAMGYDGSLVGMKLWQEENADNLEATVNYCKEDVGEYERKKEILADYSSLDPNIVEMLSQKVEGFPIVKNGVKRTWVEWIEESKILEEAEECLLEKISLQSDFTKLRDRIVKMLDENEACPEIERLPISAFDLDGVNRDQKMKAAREEREDKRLELESNCVSMDRIASWIKSTFWEKQRILGRCILSIFGTTEVTNYAPTPDNPNAVDMLELERSFKDSTSDMMENEIFCPLKLYTPTKLQLALNRKIRFHQVDERQEMDDLLSEEDEEEHEINSEEIEDQLENEGMTTHRFVETSNHYYSQFECYDFAHPLANNRNLTDDCKKLRSYFNKLFDEIYAVKEREMSLVKERNERIRYIDSELQLLFDQSVPKIPVDPDWNCKEIPESIVRVQDHEVKVRPYVSPSQQDLLDKQAIEAERLRQILLADVFKEKALMIMMDGVLEIRWEDVTRKDVAKPRCMLTKEPDQYNTEDILAIRQYEKDVIFLNQERLRYRTILEAEFAKIGEILREGIDKFNFKLQDFSVVKMKVEAAIQQLNLRYIRGCIRHSRRFETLREDDEIRSKIEAKKNILVTLNEQLRVFEGLLQEYKNEHEALMTREKTVQRKFRSDFPSLGKGNAELLEKEFKRRPRVILKNSTASDFIELGRTAASHNKVSYLSHECKEYLEHLESLDVRPVDLPENVESHHWNHLVRMRRNRIELEMKIKAQMADVNETEKTIMDYNGKIIKCKTDISLLKEQLSRMRQEAIDFDYNMEVQLVLKMGQIEVKSNGRRHEMANAILIPRKQIESINKSISKAGSLKLKALNHAVNFRREIRFKEWEHKCLKMKIVDLEEDLRTIENFLVTRNITEYLKGQSKGNRADQTSQQFENEFEAMKKSCEKRLRNWILRLKRIEGKIASTKRDNKAMDKKIEQMNIDRWELEWQRDVEGEAKREEYHYRRMAVVVRRSKLVRKLQKEYTELLALQTEHELARLRRFPTINVFRTLDDEPLKKVH